MGRYNLVDARTIAQLIARKRPYRDIGGSPVFFAYIYK